MAPSNETTTVGKVREENKVSFEEMKKQVNSTTVNAVAKDQGLKGVGIMLSNLAKSDLVLMQLQQWSGYWHSGGPEKVIKAEYGRIFFPNIVQPPAGSKAGVKYAARGHQSILVWHVPLLSEGEIVTNKVYFEDGPEGEVDWNAIERRLDGTEIPPPSPNPAGFATINQYADAGIVAAFTEPTN